MESPTPTGKVRVWHLFLLALLVSGTVACVIRIPAIDTMNRYAPAAEAFARGDWTYAFHPRIGIVFSALAGSIIRLAQVNGVVACKTLCVLFFSLAVFPLHDIFRRIYGARTAFWATLCFIFFAQMLRYVGWGLREPGSVLGLALMVQSIVAQEDRPSWKNVLQLSFGSALLTVLRAEGILLAAIFALFAARRMKDWRKILAAALLYLVLIIPQCVYNVHAIGYPVPELRHGMLLQKLGMPPVGTPAIRISPF